MSKERLQKIKVKLAEIDTHFVVGNHKEAYQGLYELEGQYHIDWLIQQAEEKIQLEERVKSLIHENTEIRKGYSERSKRVKELERIEHELEFHIKTIETQNQRYRDVLEKLYKFDGDVQEHSALADMLCGEILEGEANE